MPDAESPAALTDQRVPVRWGLGDAAVGWLVAQIGAMISATLVLRVNGLGPEDFDELSLGWIAIAQLGLWFGLLGAPWLVTRLKGNGLARDLGLRLTGRDVPVGAGAGFLTQVGVFVLYLPVFWLTDADVEEFSEPARALSDQATDPVGVALLVLVVGVGAPIVEEIFYRGLLQRSLVRRFGTWPGVVGTAVIFGAVHFQPLQFPALAAFGLVAGVLAQRSGRLGPAIAAHMVFNLSAVVSLVSGS